MTQHDAAVVLTLTILIPTTILLIILPIAFLVYYLESYTHHLKNHAQDSPLVISLGRSFFKRIMTTIDDYFLIRWGLVGWVMDREARDALKRLKRRQPRHGGFCFYGDSEFTFWPRVARDIQPWLFEDEMTTTRKDGDDLGGDEGIAMTTRKCVTKTTTTTTTTTKKSANDLNNIGLGLDPNVPIFNAAFGGSRTIDVLKEKWLHQLCLDYKPKYVIVHVGMNDYCFRMDESTSIRDHQYHDKQKRRRPWSLLDRTVDNLIELLTRIAAFESVERVLWYPPSVVGGLDEPRTREENQFYDDLRGRLQRWIDDDRFERRDKEGGDDERLTTPVEILEFCNDMNDIYADNVHIHQKGCRYNTVDGRATNYAVDGCHLLDPAKREVGAKLRRIFYGDYDGSERLTTLLIREEEEESMEQEEKKSL